MATRKKKETSPADLETDLTGPFEVDIETVLTAMTSVMKHQADLLETQTTMLNQLLERIPPRTKLS